jgi:signal transduction histidine kinase
VQGALVNVRRHAHAQHATVTFSQEGDELEVLVEDDGVGFDLGSVDSDIGLQSMRERAESVGGWMKIVSAPGAGTRVRVGVPLGDASREFQIADTAGAPRVVDRTPERASGA